MAVIKALLFALLVINIQSAFGGSVLDAPVSIKASPAIKKFCENSRVALRTAVGAGFITLQQAEEVFSQHLAAAQKNQLSQLAKVDTYLGRNVEEPIRARIVLNAIQKNLHVNPPSDLKAAIALVVDSAVKAKIIPPAVGKKLKDNAPSDVKPNPA